MARILVIDDENNIRLMIRLALEHAGHIVEAASDGPEGLQKFGDGSGWDLVLLDQRMPGMEGLEALRQMRSRDSASKVILITAFGTIDLAVEAGAAGASDFLRKPFTADILRGAVQAVLQSGDSVRAESLPTLPLSLSTINGFHLETLPEPPIRAETGITCAFSVDSAGRDKSACSVHLTSSVIEELESLRSGSELPGGNRFWQGLCGEALANYVWQNAETPAGGRLEVQEISSGLRRWLDSVLNVESAA